MTQTPPREDSEPLLPPPMEDHPAEDGPPDAQPEPSEGPQSEPESSPPADEELVAIEEEAPRLDDQPAALDLTEEVDQSTEAGEVPDDPIDPELSAPVDGAPRSDDQAGAGDLTEEVDEAAEAGEVPDDLIDPDLALPEDVSLFVVPAPQDSAPISEEKAPREMGWKMMAVAGALLLAAGFVAGIVFPEWSAPTPQTTTTSDPVPAAEPSTPTTSAPPATTPPTTAATAPATTSPEPPPPPPVEAPLVEAPPLVVTDEPVSDVATRLVPSVVHLEIRSDSLFEQGAGSGVVFDSRGYILTAAHVVSSVGQGGSELTVRLSNGDRLPGQVVGTDPDSDVAVIQVDRTGLTPAELALGEPPRVGQLVVAVGSPWGLESSVTSGVISAVDRIVEGRLLIQSDAVLYPGNSGGALADRYGRLIGINVSIFTDSATLDTIEFQGVGFAVPIEIAHRIAQALMAGEPVHTAFLGISGRDTQGDAGVEIMEVFPGSGAEQAGLAAGDVVVGVGGRPVTGIADLAARIRHLAPGDTIVLNVLRGEDSLTLAATLLPRSEVMADQEEDTEEPPEQ